METANIQTNAPKATQAKDIENQMVVCLLMRGDEFLFMQNISQTAFRGYFTGPGGHLKVGESLREAAEREISEETGLIARDLLYNGKINNYLKGKIYTVHFFSTHSFSGELKATEEGSAMWLSKYELPWQQMWPQDRYILPLVQSGVPFEGYINSAYGIAAFKDIGIFSLRK